jgi:predicted Zn-dependent peptidase
MGEAAALSSVSRSRRIPVSFLTGCGGVSRDRAPTQGFSSPFTESVYVAEPIRCHTFDNGLALVAEPMPWLESAAFTFLVPAGCVHDPLGRGGLSSFTCEMALRGAGPRDSRRFVQDLDNLGVERSESISDAHTSFSGATLAENLGPALEIFADVLRRPHLPAEELEAGRQLMIQELRSVEDEPSHKVMVELRRRHYREPWGRPSHGELAALETTTREEIAAHFQRYYRPNGCILGVAGRLDWPRLKDAVGRLLGDWEPRPAAESPEAVAPGRCDHLDHESNQTQIGISYPSVPYRDPDYFRAWSAVGVLSGGSSARLFTEVREKRGLCYSIYATYHSLRDQGGVFCYAGTGADRAQETLDVTLRELTRLARGIEAAELGRLKARIKSALIMQQESSSSRSSSIARDWYHLGRARTLDELGRLVDELTAAGINAYLAEHPPREFTIVTLGPRKLEVSGGVL